MSAKIDNGIIVNAGLYIAERDGFINISRSEIALKAGVSIGKVQNAFGTMLKLQRAIMRKAILVKSLEVIGDGLLLKMSCCLNIENVELKEKAIKSIVDRS